MPSLRHRHFKPSLLLLGLTPVVVFCHARYPEAHTLLFVLSVCALIPLAVTLNHATEIIAEKSGDMIGGLLTSTLGNLTELIISLSALRAGEIILVKACVTGAITTKCLFMLGATFLFGGLKFHTQEFNKANARLQTGLLFLASVGLLIPSFLKSAHVPDTHHTIQRVSDANAVVLLATYALGLVFSIKTHKTFFAPEKQNEPAREQPTWPMWVALSVLGVVTLGIALVSEVFVGSVQQASVSLGMSAPFVGIIVVSLVGAAPEMTAGLSAALKNHLDLSISIAVGSASQIALFVAPVLVLLSHFIAPSPMDLIFWPGAVMMIMVATLAAIIISSGGRSAWFLGVFLLGVYFMFAAALYLMPTSAAQPSSTSLRSSPGT